MSASPFLHRISHLAAALVALLLVLAGQPAIAQAALPPHANHIHPSLVAESAAPPAGTLTLAVLMEPERGWHGYWSNPGDAGLALTLDWRLPVTAKTGAMRFPVPQTLLISGLMNHVYEHDYAVLVPLTLPANAAPGASLPISVTAQWLACTREICVPERADISTTVNVGARGAADPRFTAWRTALPAPLYQPAAFALTA